MKGANLALYQMLASAARQAGYWQKRMSMTQGHDVHLFDFFRNLSDLTDNQFSQQALASLGLLHDIEQYGPGYFSSRQLGVVFAFFQRYHPKSWGELARLLS